MKLLPQKTLKTIETDDEIQFLVIRRPGWIQYSVLVLFIAPLIWQLAGSLDLAAWFSVGILALLAVASWLGSNRTLLQVKRELITANGDLGQTLNQQISFEPHELTDIGYWEGMAGEGDSGLYATKGFSMHCLMPGLDIAECMRITDAIYRKFPDIQIGNRYYTGANYVH